MSPGTLRAIVPTRDNLRTPPSRSSFETRRPVHPDRAIESSNRSPGKEVMKTQTLVIGYALALALFLFGQRRPDAVASGSFSGVVDLTHSWNGKAGKGTRPI